MFTTIKQHVLKIKENMTSIIYYVALWNLNIRVMLIEVIENFNLDIFVTT